MRQAGGTSSKAGVATTWCALRCDVHAWSLASPLAHTPFLLACLLSRLPQVAAALGQAGAALGMEPAVFIETFNKSVPTALGLLGALGQAAAADVGCIGWVGKWSTVAGAVRG